MKRTHVNAAVLALLAGSILAPAQEAPPAGTPSPTESRPADASRPDLDTFVATSITRVALIDLLSRQSPNSLDMKIASILLSFAEALTPKDTQILRWQMQLANSANDKNALEIHLRKLLELDPADTSIQLRLIRTRIGKMQTADERIDAYERLVESAGTRLDASVRSQIALDLATLYHDRGDRTKCAEKLKLATSLDSTNKEAAAFALTFFSEKVDDPMGRLELLGNLLYSDPIDPAILTEISHEFAGGGAFKEAQRFQKLSDNVRLRAAQQQDVTRLLEELSLSWCLDGPAAIVERMNQALFTRRNQAEAVIKEYEAAQVPTLGLPPPEDVRLDPTLDRVRLIAARAAGDTVTADLAATDLRKTYEETINELANPASGVVQNPQQVNKIILSLVTELAATLGWCASQTDRIGPDLEEVTQQPSFDPADPTYLEARAWNLLRIGDAAKAAEMFAPLSDSISTARLGLAAAYEAQSRNDDAMALYRAVCREHPLTVEASWAQSRLTELSGKPDFDPELAAKMRTFAAGIPKWFEELTLDPLAFMELTAEVVNDTPAPLERIFMRVKLTNTAPLPLALGPGQTLDSRIMLSPSMQIRTETLRSGLLPDLLDIGRRLRLKPRESIEILVWPESGGIGWLAETYLREAVRVRWRLLQGYVRGPRGGMQAGPMALSTDTNTVIRPPLPESLLPTSELAQKLRTAPDEELPALVVATRAQLYANKSLRDAAIAAEAALTATTQAEATAALLLLSSEDRALLVSAALERYKVANPKVRSLLIAGLPAAWHLPEMQPFDDAVAVDSDPACRCLHLVTRILKSNDPLLAVGATAADPAVREVARLHTERLVLSEAAAAAAQSQQQPAAPSATPEQPR